MANSKISALTVATAPLAGTEVLPIVQSSATKQVTVANLTAGRDVATAALLSTKTSAGAVVDVATIQNLSSTAGTEAALFLSPTSATGNIRGARVSAVNDGANLINLKFYTGTGAAITAKYEMTYDGNLKVLTAGQGINFTANTPAAGMTSQLLNWYEEGTWTPTSFDISYSSASGSYIRIGSQVFVYFNIVLPATADANNITIVGFPFTVANLDQMRAGSIGYTNYGTACTPTAVKNTTRGNILTFAGAPVTNAAASTKTFSGVFIYRV